MNRRGFLKGILAAGVAPAVVGSGILMPIRAIALPTVKEVAKYNSVEWDYTSAELTLTIDEFSSRYLKPAMIALAKQIDADIYFRTVSDS